MRPPVGFKLFHGAPDFVEGELNIWAEGLPPGTKIRRTQLAASGPPPAVPGTFTVGYGVLYVLVNYELPEVVG